MAELGIYNALLIVSEFTVLFVSGEAEISTFTLCENSKPGYKNLTCQDDEIISLKKITYGEFQCQDASNNNICHSNVETYFNGNCLGKNNCTLPIDILYNNSCQRPSRRLQVYFKCVIPLWFDRYATRYTCANSLAEINCPGWYHIHIKKPYSDERRCGNFNTSSAKIRLITLCDGKRHCLPDKTRVSSLFHARFASVSYVCKGLNDSLVTESKQSTSSDHELDMTTIPAVNATAENDTLPILSFDNDHRIEISHHSLNQNMYLCSLGWDDFDAGVLCKSFNRTWMGKATVVNNIQDFKIAPYSLQCGGHETSLYDCNYTMDVKGCSIATVAGAICCEDKPGECVMTPSSNNVSPESSTIGVAVGIPVAVIAVICIIVVIVFIRRRDIRKNSDEKTEDNYLGHQDIALPQHPSSNRIIYTQANSTNTQHAQGIEEGQDNSYLSKDTQSPYALSEEGVYDKANEKRHIIKDTVYSRAIDTVYDSPEQHTRQERKEGTYDHVFGQKTEDHYDKTART